LRGEEVVPVAGGAVSVRVVGGEVGGPGLKPRAWSQGRKKRDSFAGALLAQGNIGLLKNVEIIRRA